MADVQNELSELTHRVSDFLAGLLGNQEQAEAFSENPIDAIEAEFGSDDLSTVDLGQAMRQAAEAAGLSPEVAEQLQAAAESTDPGVAYSAPGPGTTPSPVVPEPGTPEPAPIDGDQPLTLDQLVAVLSQNVQIVYEDNDYITNNIDQSLDIHGEVHGNVEQANTSDVTNATGEGSVAVGGDVVDSGIQSQTGDGIQVGGDNDGLANVGDNSGQMAGDDAYAANVTSGSGNQVGSDGSTVGDGNVNMEDVMIDESAVEFGEGDNTQQADEIYDSYNTDTTDTDINVDVDADSHDQYTEGSHNTDEWTDNSSYDSDESFDDHSQYSDDDSAYVDQTSGGDTSAHTHVDD